MINLAKYILRKLRPLLPFHILRFVINLYFNRHVYNFLKKNGFCHLFTTGGSVAYYKKL